MATYKGRPARVAQPIAEVYNRIASIESWQQRLDALPAEARQKLGDVRFTTDSIVITAQPVGEICFKVDKLQEPTLVSLQALHSPVPFEIAIHLSEAPDAPTEATLVSTELNVEIPAMLKPMVGGKLQEAADKFADLISLFFAQ